MLGTLMVEALCISVLITVKVWSIATTVNDGLSQETRALKKVTFLQDYTHFYIIDLGFTIGSSLAKFFKRRSLAIQVSHFSWTQLFPSNRFSWSLKYQPKGIGLLQIAGEFAIPTS